MKFHFVRHAESDANLSAEFSNSGNKHPLTAEGMAQVHSLAGRLAGLKVERIYSSPVLRAVQTAQILAESLGAPWETNEALREWSVGIFEGTTDPAGWELHRQVQERWFLHRQFDSRMPGGESFHDIQARFEPFIRGLLAGRLDPGKDIILVAHGGIYAAMLPVTLRNIDFDFVRQHPIPNAGFIVAEARPDGLYCLSWCGIPLGG